MDEAERCHKLAYIAYGNLLAKGSAASIIQSQGLSTYEISGNGLMDISKFLEQNDAIEQTVIFGSTLHVSGKNPQQIEDALQDQNFKPIPTSLEDVFIYMMKHTTDNFREDNDVR